MTEKTKAEEALESLERNAGESWDDVENRPLPAYFERAQVSKDGEAVIVRMTPSQIARFVDMVFEERD